MKDFFERLLKKYDSKETELQLKARFLLLMILCGMLTVFITMIYTGIS
jgi:hypothetical protein